MCEIAGIKFINNIWNAPVPLTIDNLRELNYSDSGAIVFKTITLKPHKGNPDSWKLYEWGSENNIALHNNGVDSIIQAIKELRTIYKPIFISIYGSEPDLLQIIKKLNTLCIPILIEWNISCPNVHHIIKPSKFIYQRLKSYCKHPLGIKVGYKQNIDYWNDVDFITAINTINGKGGAIIHEKAMEFIGNLSNITTTPIIGVGGVENMRNAYELLNCGAIAVEIGTGYLRHGVSIFNSPSSVQIVINNLLEKSFVKHGRFMLKSGQESDIYIDFRSLLSYPAFVKQIIYCILNRISGIKFDVVCGVPQGAIPWASLISFYTNKPLIMYREKNKEHGLRDKIHGDYSRNSICLLVEDVITTGTSVLNVAEDLKKGGLIVNHCVCLLNRSPLNKLEHIIICNLLHMNDVEKVDIPNFGKITQEFIKLRKIIKRKKTKICFSADLSNVKELLEIVDRIGSKICLLKLHYDIITDLPIYLGDCLHRLATKHDFAILLDRKFADIGSTVEKQLLQIKNIIPFDFVTAHINSGEEAISILCKYTSVFLVAQMSSNSNCNGLHTTIATNYALKYGCGVVCQEELHPYLFHLVPGIQLNSGTDTMGQQYRTPKDVRSFADSIVVGRGIYKSNDPLESVEKYRLEMETHNSRL